MWNFVNTMGHSHSGHFMGPQMNQKREFSIQVHNVSIIPGKTFANPNFVNRCQCTVNTVHSYENSFITTPFQKISHVDRPNVNNGKFLNVNCALVNSSQSIIDTIKENQLDIVKHVEPNCEVVKTAKTKPIRMSCSRKRNKRSRKNRRRKAGGKNSKQNMNRQKIRDMMDVDLETDSINASSISMSPKICNDTFNLTDFIVESPNKPSSLLKEDKSHCDSDKEDLMAILSISPINKRTSVRERQLSTTESEDSFIVFDGGSDEELECSKEFSEESEDETEDESEDEKDSDSPSSAVPHKRVSELFFYCLSYIIYTKLCLCTMSEINWVIILSIMFSIKPTVSNPPPPFVVINKWGSYRGYYWYLLFILILNYYVNKLCKYK
ncbi:hypothetical protein NQ314_009851 [Rhamnusium bicolor]|uniref:Uncharacterized protein n=1 Tax=Rhamnusium bicolor TaxID=1586634 RepID=A0AAV8XVN9_9CUCU|nr:hypothetical protein NQ314_009851 [Rhamnusium bicolor]